MKRFVPACLAVVMFACGHPVPIQVQPPSDYPCHRPPPEEDGLLPGAPRPGTAGEGKPPALLSVELTLGGQPISHMLPAEQVIRTPVPIYIEPPTSYVFKKAILSYKPFGALHYKTIPMAKSLRGRFAVIPCGESTFTDTIQYYISMIGEKGEVLESLGSEDHPFRVKIKHDIEGGFPSVPGMGPPCPCPPQED